MQPLWISSIHTAASKRELETWENALTECLERSWPNWSKRKSTMRRPLIALNLHPKVAILLKPLQPGITSTTRTLRDQSITRLTQRIWSAFWMWLQQTITITQISTSSSIKDVLMASHTSMMAMVPSLRFSLLRRGTAGLGKSRKRRKRPKVASPIQVD